MHDTIKKFQKFSDSSHFSMASSGEIAATKLKKLYRVKFADSWRKSFPIGRVNDNPHAFYCTIPCKKSVFYAHMVINDVKQHCKGTIHKQNEKAIKMTRKISFSSSNSDDSDFKHQILRSEVKHTNFFIQHNIPFAVADHLSLMYQELFPDSKIAKNFKCSRTKTTCIMNQAMRPLLRNELTEYMKEEPFSLLNDGSSDTGLKKMNAVAVNIFDVNRSKKVECKFYDMCVTTGEHSGKAENIFSAIDSTMTNDGVDWNNLVSIGLDNTNSNMGIRNSIKSRILQKNSDVFCLVVAAI